MLASLGSRLRQVTAESSATSFARLACRSFATDLEVVKKEVRLEKDVQIPSGDLQAREVTVEGGQAFKGDLRSASGLGLGDHITSHTAKWLQVGTLIGYHVAHVLS